MEMILRESRTTIRISMYRAQLKLVRAFTTLVSGIERQEMMLNLNLNICEQTTGVFQSPVCVDDLSNIQPNQHSPGFTFTGFFVRIC